MNVGKENVVSKSGKLTIFIKEKLNNIYSVQYKPRHILEPFVWIIVKLHQGICNARELKLSSCQ